MAYNCISRWSGALGVCAIVAVIRPAHADPRAVVELFTSQGCSSCPPADRVLGELAKDPSVIALSLPIDYWDYLGWKDTLADSRFSARQKAYSRARGDREVYTPQAVVNGAAHVIGSDLASIESAIGSTAKAAGRSWFDVRIAPMPIVRRIGWWTASRGWPPRCTSLRASIPAVDSSWSP